MCNDNLSSVIDKKIKTRKRKLIVMPKVDVISDFGISFQSIYNSLNEQTTNTNTIEGNFFDSSYRIIKM